jgi:serine/threonine protein kinase
MLSLGSDRDTKTILIKTAPETRFRNETEALELCQGQKSIRQLIDVTDHPESLVLEYLDKTLYDASCEQRLDRQDIKRAVRTVLDGLAFLHAHKRAHTGES